MTGEELNILSKIKVRSVEEQRDYLLEQNMLLTGKIATLEKENAELKEKKEVLECDNYNANCNLNLITDQLTKAKELIEDMYDKIPASHSDYYKDVMERARQFLSEVEK